MPNVYAVTGKTFTAGKGFVFTGNSSGGNWEIDYPASSGIFIHGVTQTTTDEFTPKAAWITVQGPQFVSLSSNVTAGDEVTCDTLGRFKVRGSTDVWDGVALKNGVSGGSTPIIVFNLQTPISEAKGGFGMDASGMSTGVVSHTGAAAWATASGTTSQVLIGGILQSASGRVSADQTTTSASLVDLTGATVTITTSASTKVMINASYSMSNSSALGSNNRVALVIDGSVEANSAFSTPLISNVLQGGSFSILKTGLSAGSHTFKLQWMNNNGTTQCRPVGTTNEHASITVMEITV